MTAGILGVEQALGEMQKLVDESKHKDTEIQQLRQAAEELRDERDAERENNKKFAPFADIILDPLLEEPHKKVSIRSGVVYKELVLRTQQLYGNMRPVSIQAVAENCLAFALSSRGWRQVMKDRYSERLKEQPDAE